MEIHGSGDRTIAVRQLCAEADPGAAEFGRQRAQCGYAARATLLILRHSSAHVLHAWAHAWQCSIWNFAHSAPQASQTSAQSWHRALACSLRLVMNWAAAQQIAEQSRSMRMQLAISETFGSRRHACAHTSQACAHARQASMHDWNCCVCC